MLYEGFRSFQIVLERNRIVGSRVVGKICTFIGSYTLYISKMHKIKNSDYSCFSIIFDSFPPLARKIESITVICY